MDIKRIIKEEIDDFDWMEKVPSLQEPVEGSHWFIVDSGNWGTRSNKEHIRHIIKLGEVSTDINGKQIIDMYHIRNSEMGEFEFYTEDGSLDLSNVSWDFDDDDDDENEIELSWAKELIQRRYWRPWSERGVDINYYGH